MKKKPWMGGFRASASCPANIAAPLGLWRWGSPLGIYKYRRPAGTWIKCPSGSAMFVENFLRHPCTSPSGAAMLNSRCRFKKRRRCPPKPFRKQLREIRPFLKAYLPGSLRHRCAKAVFQQPPGLLQSHFPKVKVGRQPGL